MRGRQGDASLRTVPAEAATTALGFEEFFESERDRLLAALYLTVGNRADAEELTQDAFAAAWERWDRVRALESPTGYLFRTAMNGSRMRFRRARIAARRFVAPASERDLFGDVAIEEEIRRGLGMLSPRQRAALVLTDLIGFNSAEAGAILRIKPATVRSLAAQAREELRNNMEDPRE